ncbi:UNVERIFIED_CONTAM: hypothetical protein FKN15_004947 [Acipenser sinensis]
MVQILEHLSSQQVPPAPAPAPPALAPEHTPALPVAGTEVEQQDVVMSEEEQDALSLAASWDEELFLRTETQDPDLTQVMARSSEIPAPSNLVRAKIEWADNFLQVPCKASLEQHRSVFRPVQTSTPQPFPAFPDFLEEVKSSWQHPASVPSVSKSAAALASMDGAEAAGLAQFPPVDSTIAGLVRVPSSWRSIQGSCMPQRLMQDHRSPPEKGLRSRSAGGTPCKHRRHFDGLPGQHVTLCYPS